MGYHNITRRVVSMRTQRGRNVQKARSRQLTLQHQTWTGEPRPQPCTYTTLILSLLNKFPNSDFFVCLVVSRSILPKRTNARYSFIYGRYTGIVR